MTARESRVEKAAATRRRVLEQALTLFLEQGFAATTSREIADRAHVTERTLFNLAANKSDLLRQVLLTFVFTDDFGPLLERKDFQPVLRTHTVAAFLTEFTHWEDNLHQQTSAAAAMTRAAAGADPGAAEAASSLAVLSGHETYWRLVIEQQWSPFRYRRWLRRHCAAELNI